MTQLEAARTGLITTEMRRVAQREGTSRAAPAKHRRR